MEKQAQRRERVLIVGGSSGMGLARGLAQEGAKATTVGRSEPRSEEARASVAGSVQTIATGITQEDQVARLFDASGPLDHIVSTAADIEGAYRPAPRGLVVSAINGGLASLAAALAVELGPIRCNLVFPGYFDSPFWEHVAGGKAATLDAMAQLLPAVRLREPGGRRRRDPLPHAQRLRRRNGASCRRRPPPRLTRSRRLCVSLENRRGAGGCTRR